MILEIDSPHSSSSNLMEFIEQELDSSQPIAIKVAIFMTKVFITLAVIVFGYFLIYDPEGGINLWKNFYDWVVDNPGKFATIVVLKIFMGMAKLAMLECCVRCCHKCRKARRR